MISKRPRCFLDIEIGNEYVGRIIVELFADICPITCENFRLLCSGEKGIGKTTKKPLHYKGSGFHRIVKNFVIQGGDFVFGDGRGGESVYGGQFKDENFTIPHDQPFILSMANKGKDSNGSQFFITTQAAPHLDGKHTVFGKVVTGTEVVSMIENVETDSSCKPLRDVKITNSGEMVLQVKAKEKKKKRSATSSDSDSDVKSKSRKKRKHVKKHKRDRKEHKRSSADRESEDDDKCLIDPEEIPSVPTNRFLLRNTSPMTDERRNFNRSRDSYSFSRRPQTSKSGRKIKGRGFMRYRTPSPTGSRSGSETPPHWKQAQSRLRKMPLPTKESTPEEPQAQEAVEQPEDEEMAIQNSLLPSRLGIMPKTSEGAIEGSRKNASNERKRKSSADIKFLERYTSNREDFQTSPLRSKIVVKPSRENKDENSERKFVKEAEIKGRKEFINERKSFTNASARSTNFQKHVINESRVSKNKITKKPEKTAEEIANEKKRFRSLKLDLFRYTNYDDDSDDEDDTPRKKTPAKNKPVEKENKTEGNEDNLTNNPITSEKLDEDFKLSKSGSNTPKLQTEKNSLECPIQNEPETLMSLDVKLQDHAKPLVEKLDDYHDNDKYSVQMSDSRIVSNDVSAEKMLNGNPDMLCTHVKSDADNNLASVELNAIVTETQPKTPNVESLPAMTPKSPVQSIENFHVEPSTNEDTLSGMKFEKEIHEEQSKTEENLALPKSKQSDHEKQVKPATPEGSPPQKRSTSPVKKYARSSRSSSSSSPSAKRRKMPKSPSDKVAPSSEKSRASVDRRSKSPNHKPSSSSSSHRTGRSLASRRSKSRSRSRSGRRSSSPRSRDRRRASRSPDNRVRRSRSRPRNERGSRFHQYQGMRHYSPPRRGNYYRPYTKSPSYRGRIKSNAHRSRSRSRSLSRRRRRQRRSSSSSASSSRRSSSSDSDARKNKSRKLRKKKRSSSSSSTGSSDSRSDSDE